jgi:signal transduction histidine kinase
MKLIMGILLITVLLIIGFTLKKWVSTPLKLVEEILKNENDEQIEKLIQYKGEFELIGNLFKQFLNQKKELEVAIEKAEQSNRLKAAFLNNISHEIRTPLNGILGFASLISDSQTTTEEKLRYQEIMYHSSERLIKTITDYIDVSLLFSSNFEVNYFRFRLYDVVEDILLKYKPLCENKNLRFVINIDEESKILQITSDKRVIFKILDQLMDNAIKFTFEGFVEIEIVKSSDFVYFIVKDSGIGITDELHAKIFDFFTQADNSDTRRFEGSGLGLYISSELAKLLNCKLNIESKPGSGSKFSFSLSV